MALDRIEKLIDKYFEAETTIAEEKELKDYFASSDVAQHLEQYKPIFGYVTQAKQEQFTATIPLNTKKRKSAVWLSVAASVAVLLSVGWFAFNHYNQPVSEDLGTYDDPEVAFRETQKALALISESVNKGIGSMSYINEYEQSKNKIFK
ncbi:hypothetical protein IVB69_12360 [Flavobacterium sp. J49]|uniref:hypothetical protein n=1 Tax=Flavobacterium sp. J49 TaxID=2718534 RepID=UPI0015932ACD|nr:hypothetical protein [Flavobacterium sp. J49]MBF6642276.1 hypothetical protein [Flavobacterium sp. J49]NIC03522.1 hypothetical protein [Flavobacterium sp. J49]